jgi:hypothetical protein
MNRCVTTVMVMVALGSFHSRPLWAQAPEAPIIAACSLLPKEEVKQHLPWIDFLDDIPIEEAPIGDTGSSCNYPSVFIQVRYGSFSVVETGPEKGQKEPISELGDEAWFRNNNDSYAELYVRSGNYVLTLQADVNDTVEAVKPGVLSLARALLEALP